MRGGHEGPDVLHLHAGLALEDEGGPRARVRVPRDGGFAHVSCLAEQAKILIAEAMENNLGFEAFRQSFVRLSTCSLCEQDYHGVVACALGWASWKTYVGRPETDAIRCMAMNQLGNGLYATGHYEDALSVREAELSMVRRLGAPEKTILAAQGNLASTYMLGRLNMLYGCRRTYTLDVETLW